VASKLAEALDAVAFGGVAVTELLMCAGALKQMVEMLSDLCVLPLSCLPCAAARVKALCVSSLRSSMRCVFCLVLSLSRAHWHS